jgi:hypothetical protein
MTDTVRLHQTVSFNNKEVDNDAQNAFSIDVYEHQVK